MPCNPSGKNPSSELSKIIDAKLASNSEWAIEPAAGIPLPARFLAIAKPPEDVPGFTGMMQAGKEQGLINVETIVAFKLPEWSSSQGPTEFVAVTGERGWVRESYINLYALLTDPKQWKENKQNKWLEKCAAPSKALQEPKK